MKFIRFLVLAVLLAPFVGVLGSSTFAYGENKTQLYFKFEKLYQDFKGSHSNKLLFKIRFDKLAPDDLISQYAIIRPKLSIASQRTQAEKEEAAFFDGITPEALHELKEFIEYYDSITFFQDSYQEIQKHSDWLKKNFESDMRELEKELSYSQPCSLAEANSRKLCASKLMAQLCSISKQSDRDARMQFVEKMKFKISKLPGEEPVVKRLLSDEDKLFSGDMTQLEDHVKGVEDIIFMKHQILEKLTSDAERSAFNKAFEEVLNAKTLYKEQATSFNPTKRSKELVTFLKTEAEKKGIKFGMPDGDQSQKQDVLTSQGESSSETGSEDGSDEGQSDSKPFSLKKLLEKPASQKAEKPNAQESSGYKYPFVTGVSIGGALLGASIITSALSYDSNNPPVDENGNVISQKVYVWQQLKSFDPKTVQCWLKVGAVAAALAGIGVKLAAPAA